MKTAFEGVQSDVNLALLQQVQGVEDVVAGRTDALSAQYRLLPPPSLPASAGAEIYLNGRKQGKIRRRRGRARSSDMLWLLFSTGNQTGLFFFISLHDGGSNYCWWTLSGASRTHSKT